MMSEFTYIDPNRKCSTNIYSLLDLRADMSVIYGNFFFEELGSC